MYRPKALPGDDALGCNRHVASAGSPSKSTSLRPVVRLAAILLAILATSFLVLPSTSGYRRSIKVAARRTQQGERLAASRLKLSQLAANGTERVLGPQDKYACLQGTFEHGTASVEEHVWSQYNEDGIIAAIFRCIGSGDKYYVEFGAETCEECTTRYLREQGWRGLVMDGSHEDASINLQREYFTAASIVPTLAKHSVPPVFDLLTLDIDLNTFYVLQALLAGGYRPRALVVEFNRNLPPYEALVVEYRAAAMWGWSREDCYFGASIYALDTLLSQFGYTLLAQDSDGINLYAVRLTETGGAKPVAYRDVLRALPARSQLCWGIHAPCPGRQWALVPEGLNMTRPLREWEGALLPVMLGQAEERISGKAVQIFTKYDLVSRDGELVIPAGHAGMRLDAGCPFADSPEPNLLVE